MRERNKNMDLLRVISAFMVVVLHVSANYVGNNIKNPNIYFIIGNLFDSVTRICVPIFVMLSGSFILDNPKNKEYKKFYNKTFKRIIIPTLVCSILYLTYTILIQILIQPIDSDVSIVDLVIPVAINWAKGEPFYHLWYMYMIIGLYAVTPVLIRIKDDIGDKMTFKLGWGLVFLGIIIEITSKLYWPIKFIPYLGYFILGYSLRKYYVLNPRKPYKYILGTIISGFSVFMVTEFIVRNGWIPSNQLFFYGNLTPFVISESIFMYISFLNLNIKKIYTYSWIDKLAKQSFNIYMIHAGILSIIDLFKGYILMSWNPNPIWYVPLMSIIVFSLSYIGSLIIEKIVNLRLLKQSKCNTIKPTT